MADNLPNIEGDNGLIREATPVVIVDAQGEVSALNTPSRYAGTGTLSALNDVVELTAPNTAGAVIAVRGTFVGTITVTGSVTDAGDTKGERLLFKSGVGALGRNTITNNGTAINNEYRIISGGNKIIVEATEWTSGSAVIEIEAQVAPNSIFINGPVHSALEQATRAGRAFTSSTGALPVASGETLHTILRNPSDSGVNIFLYNRLFGNNIGATNVNPEYIAYGNPTATLASSGNGFNADIGGPASAAEFSFEAAAEIAMGGFTGTGEILPRGAPYNRDLLAIIKPGVSIGFTIAGAGNNLSQAARLSITFEWYEESVN